MSEAAPLSGGGLGPGRHVGDEAEVEIGPMLHGGHALAYLDGRAVFVRHAIPGERVVARITASGSRHLRADAVEVLAPSPDRVTPPCPLAEPGGCGGCDFQHISPDRQRRLLADIVSDQLRRIAHIEMPVVVETVPGDVDGLRWRTRVRWTATADHKPGLHRYRSHDVVHVDDCLIASGGLPDVSGQLAAGAAWAQAVVTSTGMRAVETAAYQETPLVESAIGREWTVSAGGFWQVHPNAVDALAGALIEGLRPRPGERCWDLFAGVGVFAGALAGGVGPGGKVIAVEGNVGAAAHARHNLADLDQIRVVTSDVARFVRSRIAQGRLDLVVLDPPRTGAGRGVVEAIARPRPRAVGYVACDPAALATDLATFAAAGYRLVSLRAFWLFPMTHHVECVALITKIGSHMQ